MTIVVRTKDGTVWFYKTVFGSKNKLEVCGGPATYLLWRKSRERYVFFPIHNYSKLEAVQGPVVQSIVSLTSLRGQLVKCFTTL